MSLPWQVQNMHEDIYEECLVEAKGNVALADLLFEEKLEALGD